MCCSLKCTYYDFYFVSYNDYRILVDILEIILILRQYWVNIQFDVDENSITNWVDIELIHNSRIMLKITKVCWINIKSIYNSLIVLTKTTIKLILSQNVVRV